MAYDDPSKYTRKLYLIAFALTVIAVLFVAVLALNTVAGQMGLPSINLSYGNSPAQNVQIDPGRTPPPGMPSLPDTSMDGDRQIVSMAKSVGIVLADPAVSGWSAANPGWRLIHAGSDTVNCNGLSDCWYMVLKGNDSILTATVMNGKLSDMFTDNTLAMAVAGTKLDQLWDSTWVMYNLTSEDQGNYTDSYFRVEYLDDGKAGVYTIFGSGTGPAGSLAGVKVDAATGKRIGGEVADGTP